MFCEPLGKGAYSDPAPYPKQILLLLLLNFSNSVDLKTPSPHD